MRLFFPSDFCQMWPLESFCLNDNITIWSPDLWTSMSSMEEDLSTYLFPCISESSSCTSSMPEMLLTPSFLRENCSFLSSAVAVLCTTFFFLRADPYRAKKMSYITNHYPTKWFFFKKTKHNTFSSLSYLPACTTAHLAANADLRLQFGKLLLVHYRLLHLT